MRKRGIKSDFNQNFLAWAAEVEEIMEIIDLEEINFRLIQVWDPYVKWSIVFLQPKSYSTHIKDKLDSL